MGNRLFMGTQIGGKSPYQGLPAHRVASYARRGSGRYLGPGAIGAAGVYFLLSAKTAHADDPTPTPTPEPVQTPPGGTVVDSFIQGLLRDAELNISGKDLYDEGRAGGVGLPTYKQDKAYEVMRLLQAERAELRSLAKSQVPTAGMTIRETACREAYVQTHEHYQGQIHGLQLDHKKEVRAVERSEILSSGQKEKLLDEARHSFVTQLGELNRLAGSEPAKACDDAKANVQFSDEAILGQAHTRIDTYLQAKGRAVLEELFGAEEAAKIQIRLEPQAYTAEVATPTPTPEVITPAGADGGLGGVALTGMVLGAVAISALGYNISRILISQPAVKVRTPKHAGHWRSPIYWG